MRWIPVTALLVCLSIPETASAQRYYRGHRGGWDNGRHYYGGYYHRGYYPYATFGFSYGYPWSSYSYGYPGTAYSYSYPDSTYYYTAPRTSYYYDPGLSQSSYVDGSDANRAYLQVIVPDPNSEIYIQNQRMSVTGSVRDFVSPDLEPGKTFTYTIMLKKNVSGRMQEETRKVDVAAGSRVIVDFNRPDGARISQPREQLPVPRQ